MLGIALLDKPDGVTSFRALSELKRSCKTKKVGHTGTLDPFATGLMVALVGQATRLARFFSGLDKSYRAVISFGTETDSSDATGRVVRTAAVPDRREVLAAVSRFVGTIEQVPPAFSAVHVDGKRAHERARAGESFEVPSRVVTVHSFELFRLSDHLYVAEISCGSGTYIRSLARDLGRLTGSAAHLSELRRVSVGPFLVDEAVAPGEFLPERDLRPIVSGLRALPTVETVDVSSDMVRRIRHGQKIAARDIPALARTESDDVLLTHEDAALAVVTVATSGTLDYRVVFSEDGPHR